MKVDSRAGCQLGRAWAAAGTRNSAGGARTAVTYRSDHGERTGVLSGDAIYAMPPDVPPLDLAGRGADGLRTAGRTGSALTGRGGIDEVTPGGCRFRARSIRDSLCFRDHMHRQKRWGRPVLMDIGTASRRSTFLACPSTFWWGPYDDAPTAPGSAVT